MKLHPPSPEPEEGPPAPPGRGASRMLRGLMLHRRAVLGTPKCEKSVGRRGCAPAPAGGAYSAPPDLLTGGEGSEGALLSPSPRTALTILSLCLSCVYVHTCMKMHCYFLLNVKRGGLQLSSAGTDHRHHYYSARKLILMSQTPPPYRFSSNATNHGCIPTIDS